uniref:Uncharacterized protein n=1 Tax=Siphoviridae sp. ct3fB6 TaxID=2827770 RepID=A0A8S5T7P5_9CAUD|nr:MAG TPA: Protein of unknown function (DUF3755) [Siphoviridae sp. ct3fB6]
MRIGFCKARNNIFLISLQPLNLDEGGRFFYFLTRYAKPTSPHIYTRE